MNVELQDDPDLLSDVLSALSKRIQSGMNLYRSNILGKVPKDRDEFEPRTLLRKLEGGSKVLVLDSNTDLPRDWDILDLKEKYGVVDDAGLAGDRGTEDGLSSDGGSSDGGSSIGDSEGEAVQVQGHDPVQGEGLQDDLEHDGEVGKPKRVLVFTTCLLLALLAVCRSGSVDGTFKAMSKQWKQLFIMMVEYKGAFIPVAFGWLPDKSEVSYHVFLVLLMEAYHAQLGKTLELFGRSKMKLKKIKLDFEKAIHNALGAMFTLKGCFFHFR